MNIICRWNIVYFYNIQINYWQRFTIKIYLLQVLCDFICDGEGNNHKRGYKLFCVMKFRRNVYISLCFETSTELDYQITYWHKTGLSNYLLPHNKVYTLFLLESPPLLTTQYWLLNTVVFVFYTSLSQHINMRKYHIRFSSHLSSVL